MIVGALIGLVVEFFLIRPLYRRHIEQVLVTVGPGAGGDGRWCTASGVRPAAVPPARMADRDHRRSAARAIPNDRFLLIGAAASSCSGCCCCSGTPGSGLIIRAGVENRTMVQALGIDVRRTFTLVFAIGGAAAALGGVLGSVYPGRSRPAQGTALLIYAFIVVVIGGFGSIGGTAVAALVVGLVQQLRELLPVLRHR